jgi:transposase
MSVICSSCKKAMTEERRSHHKRRKWICRHCGNVTYQTPRKKGRGAAARESRPQQVLRKLHPKD